MFSKGSMNPTFKWTVEVTIHEIKKNLMGNEIFDFSDIVQVKVEFIEFYKINLGLINVILVLKYLLQPV